MFRAKLHYTDTGYEHHQFKRTSSQQFYNKFAAMAEPNISICQDVACDEANFCPLVVFVVGVRSRCPSSEVWLLKAWRYMLPHGADGWLISCKLRTRRCRSLSNGADTTLTSGHSASGFISWVARIFHTGYWRLTLAEASAGPDAVWARPVYVGTTEHVHVDVTDSVRCRGLRPANTVRRDWVKSPPHTATKWHHFLKRI